MGVRWKGLTVSLTAPKHQTSAAVVLPTKTVEQMSELPTPAHELWPLRALRERADLSVCKPSAGCPFKCIYCIYPQLEGKRYRLRPPEAVAQEVEDVAVRSKVRHFFFRGQRFSTTRTDTPWRSAPRFAAGSCPSVGRPSATRRVFDAELAHAMKAAGCEAVEFGQDSASDKMLVALEKPFDQEDTRVALQAAHDAGLPFAIYLLFGGPGETWADVEETQNFLSQCAPAHAVFCHLRHPRL